MPSQTAPAAAQGPHSPPSLTTQQIGRCGELLVQLRLLRLGVESAPLTTDAGVDLVAYGAGAREAVTIQVKTNLAPKPGGGKGNLCLDWWIPETSPAQLDALVDLSSDRVWLFRHEDLMACAQQRSGGRAHLYMHVDEAAKPRRTDVRMRVSEFDEFLLEQQIARFIGGATHHSLGPQGHQRR